MLCIKKIEFQLHSTLKIFLILSLLLTKYVWPNSPSFVSKVGKNKICLNMIVKNESKIIERCLNSVKDHVDCISICDTGSTDNTIELIENFLRVNQIPGQVHRQTWVNFGHNRTLSAEAARKTLEELNFPLSETYLLLLDADMVLEVDPLFKNNRLTAGAYHVLQYHDYSSHYNIRLIQSSMPWECLGATHEYWSCKKPVQIMLLDSIMIDDRNDGGCKADKFERDVMLLTQTLLEKPNDPRSTFYLAQSYFGLEKYKEAFKWYKARIALGDWKEEAWYSMLMIGFIYENLGSWNHALSWYLKAYDYNPARAEPFQKIATYYRKIGQNHLAYLFAKKGSSIPLPKDQVLFIWNCVYDYQFDEEISIAAYYIPECKEEGFAAADRLSLKKGVPMNVKEQTYKNFLFYVQPLPIKSNQISDRSLNHDVSQKNPISDIAQSQWDIDFKTQFSFWQSHYDLSSFIASTKAIPFDQGKLFLIHEIVNNSETPFSPIYLHRFVYLNPDKEILKVSHPFIFKDKGIEYCENIEVDEKEEKCLMGIITQGKKMNCIIDFEQIRRLLVTLKS